MFIPFNEALKGGQSLDTKGAFTKCGFEAAFWNHKVQACV